MPVLLPHSLTEATRMLSETPGATLLAGGTDLMVEINFNHRKPDDVISLRHVPELSAWSINESTGNVFIGSAVPYKNMESGPLAQVLPALAQAARTVGSPQIRAAGSLGGNLGTCSPAGDSLPVLSALDAVVHLVSQNGSRDVPVAEFMVGPKKNARQQNEIILGVTLPAMNGRQGYAKVGVRNAMVISVASACFALQDGTPRIALGSVGPTVLRCPQAEAFLSAHLDANGVVSDDAAKEFGRLVSQESKPIDDHRSTAVYRRHAVGVLAQRLSQRGVHS
ncbi:MAG: xanthine dehydrogenase family protein subunit M [Actinobacteria bacterium]|nr:xanthine dehydrogenase family protein subunit M [Actinomycetota bacterium]